MRIDLRIDRIVVEGVTLTPAERARLRDALQTQLAERLTRGGGLDALRAQHGAATLRGLLQGGDTDGRGGSSRADARDAAGEQASGGAAGRGGTLRMPADATPAQWGRGIADAVHGALTSGGAGVRTGSRADQDGRPSTAHAHTADAHRTAPRGTGASQQPVAADGRRAQAAPVARDAAPAAERGGVR